MTMNLGSEEKQVLIIDDDDLFRSTLLQNLEEDGYVAAEASDGDQALKRLQGGAVPDAIVLDWNMPVMNGQEFLRALREAGNDTPVLILTGHNDQIYEEAAFDAGAADFVDKSRSYTILRKRLDLILHAAKGGGPEHAEPGDAGTDLETGSLKLRTESKRAYWREKELALTVSEFEIVRLLVETDGRDVAFRDIYDVVHGKGFWAGEGEDGYRTNVRTFVKRIRKKFRDVDPDFDSIQSYPNFGYRWTTGDS